MRPALGGVGGSVCGCGRCRTPRGLTRFDVGESLLLGHLSDNRRFQVLARVDPPVGTVLPPAEDGFLGPGSAPRVALAWPCCAREPFGTRGRRANPAFTTAPRGGRWVNAPLGRCRLSGWLFRASGRSGIMERRRASAGGDRRGRWWCTGRTVVGVARPHGTSAGGLEILAQLAVDRCHSAHRRRGGSGLVR